MEGKKTRPETRVTASRPSFSNIKGDVVFWDGRLHVVAVAQQRGSDVKDLKLQRTVVELDPNTLEPRKLLIQSRVRVTEYGDVAEVGGFEEEKE